MRALIFSVLLTGAASAADVAGGGKTVPAIDVHFPLAPAVVAELGLPSSLQTSLQAVLDARLDALPSFARLPESDVSAQAEWIRDHVRTRISEELSQPDVDIEEPRSGTADKAASAIGQLERRKRELKDLLAVSVLAPDAGDVRATRERVKETLRQVRRAQESLSAPAFSLSGASRRAERAAQSATVKDPDVAKAALVAARVVDDATAAAAVMADLKSSGLHAFRTSLRKLLTVLEMLDLAPGDRSALNGMFSTAGRWRDAQVEEQWLGKGAKTADGSSQKKSEELKRWRAQFEPIAARVKPALEAVASAPAAERKKLAEKARDAIRTQAAQAARRLAAVRGEDDSEGLHSARLTIKRLGDLIEAFTGESPAPVRNLQDLLGGIHDRDMILRSLPASAKDDIVRAKAERRRLLDQLYSVDKP